MNNNLPKEIAILGLWHQGIVAAACLSDLGYKIIASDPNKEKIKNLRNGIIPIYEPGLKELVNKGIKNNRLKFVSDLASAVSNKEFVFLMFDTKVDENDLTDLTEIIKATKQIAKHLKNKCIIYNTSQVPVGTSEKILNLIEEINPKVNASIVYSPENLRLGEAIKLFLNPALPVLGSNDIKSLHKLETLLEPLNVNWLKVNLRTAEFCKHALNSFLATTISFANEIGNLCDEVGADGFQIAKALRLEPRISPKSMLRPGMGFSGGTLARDVQTLRKLGDQKGIDTHLLDGLWANNLHQNKFVIRQLSSNFKDIKDKKITILGITYKPGTSTLRRSVALETIKTLNSMGAKVNVHDPKANKNELSKISGFNFYEKVEEAIEKADAIAIMTGWDEYKNINWKDLKKSINSPFIIDCNNMYDHEELKSIGYKYICIGRGLKLN